MPSRPSSRVRPLSLLVLSGSALALCLPAASLAEKIGTIAPFLPLTIERIEALPSSARQPWRDYLAASARRLAEDRRTLEVEVPAGAPVPASPAEGNGLGTMPLNRDPAWYRSAEARAVADTIVSFQTPGGGWGKNMPRNVAPRLPGQHYVPHAAGEGRQRSWNFVGTIDNGATTTEIAFLGKVIEAGGTGSPAAYRASVVKGIDYLLSAQSPNGGWPQTWPLAGGYHDAITYNDDAMVRVLRLLTAAGDGKGGFAVLPAETRTRARKAVEAGIGCILRTQVVVSGVPTGWAQQHDALTLEPTSARNYEPAALASAESARILLFLMDLPSPGPEVRKAIAGGVAWLEKTAIRDMAFERNGTDTRLAPRPGALLWARFIQIGTNRPVFGDRDRSLYSDVMDISAERRGGYAWYNTSAEAVLKAYPAWRKRNGP